NTVVPHIRQLIHSGSKCLMGNVSSANHIFPEEYMLKYISFRSMKYSIVLYHKKDENFTHFLHFLECGSLSWFYLVRGKLVRGGEPPIGNCLPRESLGQPCTIPLSIGRHTSTSAALDNSCLDLKL